MNLDDFRQINDTLGHPNGDALLIQVAGRLQTELWESDVMVRIGGDEFGMLPPRLGQAQHIRIVVDKIGQALQAPFLIEDVPIDMRPSIGVALYPEHEADVDTLFQHADVALNTAKTQYQAYLLYDAAFDQHNPQQLRLVAELRAAIVQEALTLYYQPKRSFRNQDSLRSRRWYAGVVQRTDPPPPL